MKHLTFKTHNNANIQAKLLAKFLAIPGVEVEFSAEPEDISPSDMEYDYDIAKDIERDINRGNFYAWFCAKVTVSYKGYSADDYLGCCSYESERDFIENSGYYIDMINQCVQEINNAITDTNADICRRFKTRQLKAMANDLGFYLVPKTAIA